MLNLKNLLIQERLIKDYDIYFLNISDLATNAIKIYLFSVLICISFYKSIFLCILMIPVSLIIPFFMKPRLIKERKEKLLYEFKDFLRIMKGNLEASYSIENSIVLSLNELKMLYSESSMIFNEIRQMCMRLKMNIPVDAVFQEFALKTKIDDIIDFSDALTTVKQMGGNINKVINNVITIINDKIEVDRDIKLATASKRLEQNIMSLIPFFIILYLNFTSGEFLNPLYISFFGRIFMTILLGVYFISAYLSKKILDIKT